MQTIRLHGRGAGHTSASEGDAPTVDGEAIPVPDSALFLIAGNAEIYITK